MKIEVWRHVNEDPDCSVMLHEFEGSGFRIEGGCLVVDVNGEATFIVRSWDYAQIVRPKEA